MTSDNKILKALRDYWVFPVGLTVAAFVIFQVSLYLPPSSPECLKPTAFCEMNPLPMFVGIGSMIGVFSLYIMIRSKLDNGVVQESSKE